jgi:hypothetical protein
MRALCDRTPPSFVMAWLDPAIRGRDRVEAAAPWAWITGSRPVMTSKVGRLSLPDGNRVRMDEAQRSPSTPAGCARCRNGSVSWPA